MPKDNWNDCVKQVRSVTTVASTNGLRTCTYCTKYIQHPVQYVRRSTVQYAFYSTFSVAHNII